MQDMDSSYVGVEDLQTGSGTPNRVLREGSVMARLQMLVSREAGLLGIGAKHALFFRNLAVVVREGEWKPRQRGSRGASPFKLGNGEASRAGRLRMDGGGSSGGYRLGEEEDDGEEERHDNAEDEEGGAHESSGRDEL